MIFYLGTHRPTWLERLDVPLFVSRRAMPKRKLPRARGPWALDSGGFSELSMFGDWRTTPRQYVADVRRYADEIGRLQWAAPMDWMCEPHMLAKTGLSVAEHQRRTVENYLTLRGLAPDLPIVPVLQGWQVADYHRCADLYDTYGVRLDALPVVGVGTVCRRQDTAGANAIVTSLAARGIRLHGFGVKTDGLADYSHALASADSMAWSFGGRYEPGCSPGHKSEANCLRFALAWRERVLAIAGGPQQLTLGASA